MVSGCPQTLSEHAMAGLQLWSLIRQCSLHTHAGNNRCATFKNFYPLSCRLQNGVVDLVTNSFFCGNSVIGQHTEQLFQNLKTNRF